MVHLPLVRVVIQVLLVALLGMAQQIMALLVLVEHLAELVAEMAAMV